MPYSKGIRGGKKNLYPGRTAREARDAKKAEAEANGGWYTSEALERKNERFEEYYRTQNILSEEELQEMLAKLREDLPTTFRVTGSRAHAEGINDLIKDRYLPNMHQVEWDGVKYDPPSQLPWYPGQLAWELSAPKRVVRKSEPYKHFQKFLVGETEVGNLSRQEAVSMIPPLLMDVQPHHICLDMCAAPGSKTAQIIEALNPHHTESTGMLIANDADYKRTHMLVHQTGRMPSKGLMVTNLDAAYIPNISLGGGKTLQYDRILADVPCSGDGTLRKNIEIWKKWGANDGNNLHSLQLRILDRAMRMLKPGGRLVYSTCSFNPLENEAVVAAALNAYPGKFKLVDASGKLPELKRRSGMSSWKVATQTQSEKVSAEPKGRHGRKGAAGKEEPKIQLGKKLIWHDTYEAYEKAMNEMWAANEEQGVEQKKKMLPASCWPPANASELNLEYCLRLVPQDQNTGGFFVCVMEKASDAVIEEPAEDLPEIPAMDDVAVADEGGASTLKRAATPSGIEGDEVETKRVKSDVEPTAAVPETTVEPTTEAAEEPVEAKAAPQAEKNAGPSKQKRQRRDLTFREDPYSFVQSGNEEVNGIIKWFELNDKFERDNLLVRNDQQEPLRTIYLVNPNIKAILDNNDYTRLRIISAGVKGFVRQDSAKNTTIGCKWRIPQEGLDDLISLIPEAKVIDATLEEMRILLSEMYPPIDRFAPDVQAWMKPLQVGNIVVRFDIGKSASGRSRLPMILPVWKAQTSMSLLIDKREKSTLSIRLFDEDITLAAQAEAKLRGKNKKAAEEAANETPADSADASAVATPDVEEEAMNASA